MEEKSTWQAYRAAGVPKSKWPKDIYDAYRRYASFGPRNLRGYGNNKWVGSVPNLKLATSK